MFYTSLESAYHIYPCKVIHDANKPEPKRKKINCDIVIQDGKKLFVCPIEECKSNFTLKMSLKHHILSIHEKIKPFKCVKCNFCFGRKNALNMHVAIVHEGRKPHMCDICGSTFAKKDHLR